jgi:hypothetical protein
VGLVPARHPYSQVIPGFSLDSSLVDSHQSLVWLRATVRSVRPIPAGLLVTLSLGTMNLSVVIEDSPTLLSPWKVGALVEISTNRSEARI